MATRANRTAALLAGIAIGVVIVVVVASTSGISLLSYTVCGRGGTVGTTLFWTPYSLANAPYLGSSSYAAKFTIFVLDGISTVTLSDGQVANGNLSAGFFVTENWTLFWMTNDSKLGPGTNQPCTSAYGADQAPTNFTSSVDGFVLQGPGNTSNVNEPTTYSQPPDKHALAVFGNGFVSANSQPISTCGASAKELNFSSSSFDVSLTVQGPKGSVTAVASVDSQQNFTYYFPANAGTWLVDDLQSNPGITGPGLAFEWQAC
jgi:hypothetical protein